MQQGRVVQVGDEERVTHRTGQVTVTQALGGARACDSQVAPVTWGACKTESWAPRLALLTRRLWRGLASALLLGSYHLSLFSSHIPTPVPLQLSFLPESEPSDAQPRDPHIRGSGSLGDRCPVRDRFRQGTGLGRKGPLEETQPWAEEALSCADGRVGLGNQGPGLSSAPD